MISDFNNTLQDSLYSKFFVYNHLSFLMAGFLKDYLRAQILLSNYILAAVWQKTYVGIKS